MAALRSVFLLLVLGNVLFFAWSQGYFGRQEEGREPQRLKDQLQPEKLRIVRAEASTPVVPASPAAAPAAGTVAAVPAAAALPPAACQLVRGLAMAEAEKLRATLAAVAGLTVALRPDAEPASYWVLVPPLANKAAAAKKAAELKQRGISDFYVVNDEGAHQFAISLALFKTEQGAQEFLSGLVKKGVKSAHIEPQQKAPEHAQIEVRGPAEAVAKGLAGLPPAALGECQTP